jgi:hypothetical protein
MIRLIGMTQQFITMAKGVDKIEIVGMDELLKAFKHLPEEVNASVIRNVARKPANKIVSQARKLFKYKDTGATKRSFGILKVKDLKQKFLEIGIKGRSLAYIYLFGDGSDRQKKSGASTGSIDPTGNVVQEAAEKVGNSATKDMEVDLSKTIQKALRRYLE